MLHLYFSNWSANAELLNTYIFFLPQLRCEMKHFDLDGSFTVQLLAQLQPQGIDGHVSQTTV